MSNEAMIEVLKAHLAKEGLVICKAGVPVDGFSEAEALAGVVDVLDDAQNVMEWKDDETTLPVPANILVALARTAVA